MKAPRYSATAMSLNEGQIPENMPVSASGALYVAQAAGSGGGASSTGTQTSVASSATDVTILAANASRKGAIVINDSTSILYILLAAGTSSATNYTVKLQGGEGYELPTMQGGVYTGVIKGLWASATGNARVTEFT